MNKMREIMNETEKTPVHYHLPGLFEFYELYKVFLPLYRKHREYFYDWCDIASIYGAPVDYLKKTVSESLSGFYNDKQSFKSIKRIAAASER